MSCKKPNVKNFEYHQHHIDPKYNGGSDDPANKVRLRVYQHCMWHYTEWKRKENIEDFVAWQCLKGVCQGESHSDRAKRLWALPEYRQLWEKGSAQRILDQIDSNHFAEMGKKGGKAKSHKKSMSQLKPKRQRQLMVQNNSKLEKIVMKWVTLEHVSGTKLTYFLDTSLKPLIHKLSLLSGKVCSTTRWTTLFTEEGKVVAGWKVINIQTF